jgi:DNA adenine methylase Dam
MFIKSPLNYVGGKYKLLPQILPLFPKNINTFVDLFCGGANVAVNVKANYILCIDKQDEVIGFLTACKNLPSERMVEAIDSLVEKYNLSKTNREGYLKLREHYNEGYKTWDMFYALVTHSFNNRIRFNSKGEFNQPFGMNRSSFNPTLRQKFIDFVDHLKTLNIDFLSADFEELEEFSLGSDDFVYIDPPYLCSYTDYNGSSWTEDDELRLLAYLNKLNSKGIKFALSNVLENNGMSNEFLKCWSKNYNVHYLNYSYKNCNYQRKNGGDTVEVLITNY